MNKSIALIANHDLVLYNFRKELIKKLLNSNFKVFLVCPPGEKLNKLIALGAFHYSIGFSRHSKNIFKELITFVKLFLFFIKHKPYATLTYTIKPNIYVGIIMNFIHGIQLANITGLGLAFLKNNIFKKFIIFLYKIAFYKTKVIFVQNLNDFNVFQLNKIYPNKLKLIPGSGVNIKEFKFVKKFPVRNNILNFLFAGRIMKEKGIDLYIELAKKFLVLQPNCKFHICGFIEDKNYLNLFNYDLPNNMIYHGNLISIKKLLKQTHCLIHPSFYPEGISNVILEASSSGTPVITSNIPGCKDAVIDNKTGFIFNNKSFEELFSIVNKFIGMEDEMRLKMALNGREFVSNKFNRNIVIKYYMDEIQKTIYN